MNEKYDPAAVESAAQTAWRAADAYRVTEDQSKPKFYACSMLPYPSGKLHMGHVRNYTINDMLTRQLRMKGYNVLMPMGWDAFGLPAENAALKNAVPPEKWTRENIAYMKTQMQAMGLAVDWSREVATCDPAYYKWNQWLFLKMLEAGIAERRTQVVNWDPVDQTVLANEQVIDGRGWRSGALVEKREIPGYYLNIVQYADELLGAVANPEDPNYLSGWPERVRLMQENWIGKSQGLNLSTFPHQIAGTDGEAIQDGKLDVFTTRARHACSARASVADCSRTILWPRRPLADECTGAWQDFIADCKKGGTTAAEIETAGKEGLATTGLFGRRIRWTRAAQVCPSTSANFVLMRLRRRAPSSVCPAHDQRDLDFAKQIWHLPDQAALWQDGRQRSSRSTPRRPTGTATIAAPRVRQLGREFALASTACRWTRARPPNIAQSPTRRPGREGQTHLPAARLGRQSRQRYWGTPIPIIHCDFCGVRCRCRAAELPVEAARSTASPSTSPAIRSRNGTRPGRTSPCP